MNKSDDVKKFADLVGGRIVPKNESGKDRIDHKKMSGMKIPKFKTKEERQKFYMKYIPALYFVEIEEMNPDELTDEDFDFFWMCFAVGFNDLKKEESDMDG